MPHKDYFPDFIRALPQPEFTGEEERAWMMTNEALVLFYAVPDGSSSPAHAHGDEWGVVLEGQMDITIDGETTTYKRGDTYFVPDGVMHSVVNHPGLIGIDVFADPGRFAAKTRDTSSKSSS